LNGKNIIIARYLPQVDDVKIVVKANAVHLKEKFKIITFMTLTSSFLLPI